MKITAHRGDAARDPARAGVPLGGRGAGGREPRPLHRPHRRGRRPATASRSARTRAAVVSYGELMARQLVGRSPGDMEAILRSIWTEGRWKMFPQFTQLVVRRASRSRAGTRSAARSASRRGRSSAARSRRSSTTSASCRATTPSCSRPTRGELAGEGYRVIYLKVGRGVERDDACVAAVREAIGPEPPAADRPERGLGRRHCGRPDPPARAVRPRLGRAADARRRRERARARAALGQREDRRRPGRVHDEPAPARAREGGGRRRRPGKPRRRRAAALPPAGVRLRRARASRSTGTRSWRARSASTRTRRSPRRSRT